MQDTVNIREENSPDVFLASNTPPWKPISEGTTESKFSMTQGSDKGRHVTVHHITIHGSESGALRDRLDRALAEQESIRRRAVRECQEVAHFTTAILAKDLLPVADSFRSVVKDVTHASGDTLLASVLSRVAALERGLLTVLEKHGIQQMVPELGERFSPKWHQAIFVAEASPFPHGSVAEVLKPGYRIDNRLLRPAMVSISRGIGTDAD